MSPIAAAAFALVLESFEGETMIGRTTGFGFDTREQCEARAAEILKVEADPRLRYEARCVPLEGGAAKPEQRTEYGDPWEK